MNFKNILLTLGLAMSASTASAATVIFSGADYADALISTDGSLIGALNFGDTSLTSNPTTINTVTFAEYGPGTGSVNLSGTVTFVHNGADGSGTNGEGDAATTLTNTGVFTIAGNNGHLQFGGLTIGQTYEIQMVFSDTRGVLSPDLIEVYDQDSSAGAADFTSADISTAQIVTGTFTADALTQDFYLVQNTGVGSFDGYIGALQLRSIPEPSSTVLLGLGGVAFLLRRRR